MRVVAFERQKITDPMQLTLGVLYVVENRHKKKVYVYPMPFSPLRFAVFTDGGVFDLKSNEDMKIACLQEEMKIFERFQGTLKIYGDTPQKYTKVPVEQESSSLYDDQSE